jgi:hypothetical protein
MIAVCETLLGILCGWLDPVGEELEDEKISRRG